MTLLAAAAAMTALGLAARPAHADFPGLSRPLADESFARDARSLEVLRATHGLDGEIELAWFARALDAGDAGPRPRQGELGGRGAFELRTGRYVLGGDATEDGRFNVDSREYPSRLYAGVRWPEGRISARAVAGFDVDQYGGTDLELDLAPLTLARDGAGHGCALVRGWLRGRKFDFAGPILNPALGIELPRIGLASFALALSLTAQTDFSREGPPASFGMVQLGWSSGAALPGAGEAPGQPGGGGLFSTPEISYRWFLCGAYAFPLDQRQLGRLLLGAGAHFSIPWGS